MDGKSSGTLFMDAQKWLHNMEKLETDWWLTETGDLVTKFECWRILGMND